MGEEEEHKSVSMSTSISPIRPQHVLQNKNMNNIKKNISPSGSPQNLQNGKYYKPLIHHHKISHDEHRELCSDDGRDEELNMLKAQNQRLSHKLEHVNTELVETKVFLRSERKRNKKLFEDIKLKENEINDLSESIDSLEVEIEEKDKECIECMEKLSMAE